MSPTPIPYPEWTPAKGLTPITAAHSVELAESLPIDPYHVILYGGLHRALDRAFVSGSIRDPDAAIVQHPLSPTEPEFIGRDPEAGWKILSRLPGWTSLNGSTEDMARFAKIFGREMSLPFRQFGDLFYILEAPPTPHPHPAVRLLGIPDVPLLEQFGPAVWGNSYRTFEEMVTEGAAAGAIVDDRLVSVALVSAQNPRYADVGVHTLEPYRRRGFSSAAASLVAQELQGRGIVPIWSTGSHNVASQAVALKVGFRPIGRGEYLVFDGLGPAGFVPH